MLFKKKSLDYLFIPNASQKELRERKGRAKREIKIRGIKNIVLLDGKDSEEDVLYLGKILKEEDRVGFDTFPLHYKEYKELIKKAKRDKKFPKGVKIELNASIKPMIEFIE